MTNNLQIAMALVLGGIVCILASMGGALYLYHEHAAEFFAGPDYKNSLQRIIVFGAFVGIPTLLGFAAGGAMLAIGIRKSKSP
jgi:hypothetical protein